MLEFFTSLIGPASLIAAVSAIVFYHDWRRQRLLMLERNFEVLQEFNRECLSSDENIAATLLSVCPDDTTSVDEGRKIILQFMRINRLLRAWQQGYRRPRLIKKRDADEIVDSYVVTLLAYEDKIDVLLERGYPPRFRTYLKERMEIAKHSERRATPFHLDRPVLRQQDELEDAGTLTPSIN